MSEPKPGDRVRVTYEATWREDTAIGFLATKGIVTHGPDPQWNYSGVPSHATVEVLASPVYVNHDTTEYRVGDVVRDDVGQLWCRVARTWMNCLIGTTLNSDEWPRHPLTLLVRDGQVVAQ